MPLIDYRRASGGAASLTTAQANLTAPVSMPTAGTYYDGVTLALTAGTWLVLATIVITFGGVGHKATVRLWDGTTTYNEVEVYAAAAAIPFAAALDGLVAGGTTIRLSACPTISSTDSILANVPDHSAGANVATTLVAVKVG